MLDYQRQAQSRTVKQERQREVEGGERKQRIKQIYGQPQELTNKLMYFQELRPQPTKSQSQNPSNSRNRQRSDQCIYMQEQQQITPTDLIQENKKKRQFQTESDVDNIEALHSQNNITTNTKAMEQNRNLVQNLNIQQKQQTLTLQPIPQNESMNPILASYKNTIDLSKNNQNYIPSYVRTPITRQEPDNLLIDYLAKTKLLQKKEYNLTTHTNQNNLSPNRKRDESSLGKRKKKKKSKSKKNLSKYYTPDLQEYQIGDARINKTCAYIFDGVQDPSTYLIDQYAASKSNMNNYNESQKNLNQFNYKNIQNLKGFDIAITPTEEKMVKSKNTIENQVKYPLNNNQQLKDNATSCLKQNEKVEQEENFQGNACSLPSVNQNSKMMGDKEDPNMLEFQVNAERTLAQQPQYQYMRGLHHNLNTTYKMKGRKQTRYNMNNSMIDHSQSPPDLLINNNYKQLLSKSFMDDQNQLQNKSPKINFKGDPDENEQRQSQQGRYNLRIQSQQKEIIQRSNSTKSQLNQIDGNQQNYINLNNSNDRMNEIIQQKYTHEVPYHILQPIRNSYVNYKLKNQMNSEPTIYDEFEMQQQVRDYSQTLLQDQLQYQKQFKKQMYTKFKVSPSMRNQSNQTPKNSRSPHLPKVNLSNYLQNNTMLINNKSNLSSKYQYIVESQPRFQIKVAPRLNYNQRCKSTQPQIIYIQHPQQQYREQNIPFIQNELQYSQNMKSQKPHIQQISYHLKNNQVFDQNYALKNNPYITNEEHQQYLSNKINNHDKSSHSLYDDNVVIEKECSPINNIEQVSNIQKIEQLNQNDQEKNQLVRNEVNQDSQNKTKQNLLTIVKENIDKMDSNQQNNQDKDTKNNAQKQNLQLKNKEQIVELMSNIKKVSSQIDNQSITIEDESYVISNQKKENMKQDQLENQKSQDVLNTNQQQNKQISLIKEKKLPQINDLYYYQLNINYTQREVEDIYNKLVQVNQKKRRQCCLEPFFTNVEHVVWIDNFQIKIDSSFQNQMLFKLRIGNEDETKIYLKYEDTEITNQWVFIKLKDNLKCLPLKISEGVVLAGKNKKTSLKSFFSIIHLQSLNIDTADLDYQYVNYSEEFMKVIKSLCINNFFSNVLSQKDQNPCIQINNFPVYFPSHNTLAYENEQYIDLEDMNSLQKKQNQQYSDQQILRLIKDTLENIKVFHERNISINNININNIVYSKDTNSFKILSYVYCELNEDCLTPRQETEVEQKYNQNPIYFSLKKFNLYKRDIYALGICAIIFKFQLTDFCLNKDTIQEKINSLNSNSNSSQLNKIILELIEQSQVVRSSYLAKTYLEQFFPSQENPTNQIKQNQQTQDKESKNQNQSNQPQNVNRSIGLGQNTKLNVFENINLFETIEQKTQNVPLNTQIQELQVLKKFFDQSGKINQFFIQYQNIVDIQKQTYGLSSAIFLESLIEFYFEALYFSQKERVLNIIDLIEKENLFIFISQLPKNQLAHKFMLASAFRFLLDNNIDKSMKYFDRVLAFPNLTVQDLFQLNLNLGILSNQKQKKQKANIYLKQAQTIAKSIQKQSLNLAAPYLLSGIINEDENELQTALQIKKDNNEDIGKVMNLLFKIGSLCLKKKDFTKGEDIFRSYMQSRDELSEDVQRKNQYFQAKLNLAFCLLGKKPDHPILTALINDYLVELRQIYGQQSKETLYALYEISEVLFNLKVDLDEIIPIYIQCKKIATLINENELIIELESKIDKLESQQQLQKHVKEL